MTEEFSFSFERLNVWKLSIDLAGFVVGLMEAFPRNRFLRAVGQMEATAFRVTQNIAEGRGRQLKKKEFIQFLYLAEGSLFEVITLVELFKRRKLIGEHEANEIGMKAEVIDQKLHGLVNSLRGKC